MLAAVFFWQSIGQLIAVLMAYAATTAWRNTIMNGIDAQACSVHNTDPTDSRGMECARTVDRAWRLVAGLGAVPAAIAMVFRLTIPESVSSALKCRSVSEFTFCMLTP